MQHLSAQALDAATAIREKLRTLRASDDSFDRSVAERYERTRKLLGEALRLLKALDNPALPASGRLMPSQLAAARKRLERSIEQLFCGTVEDGARVLNRDTERAAESPRLRQMREAVENHRPPGGKYQYLETTQQEKAIRRGREKRPIIGTVSTTRMRGRSESHGSARSSHQVTSSNGSRAGPDDGADPDEPGEAGPQHLLSLASRHAEALEAERERRTDSLLTVTQLLEAIDLEDGKALKRFIGQHGTAALEAAGYEIRACELCGLPMAAERPTKRRHKRCRGKHHRAKRRQERTEAEKRDKIAAARNLPKSCGGYSTREEKAAWDRIVMARIHAGLTAAGNPRPACQCNGSGRREYDAEGFPACACCGCELPGPSVLSAESREILKVWWDQARTGLGAAAKRSPAK